MATHGLPEVIRVIDVTFGPWTRGVTGETYGNKVPDCYVREMPDGTGAEGVVRLVEKGWHWFSGGSRAFVDQTNAASGP